MLNETHALPKGLLDAKSTELVEILGAPTLIHLEGEIKKPLFVCTLLHGNETTGFYAIQQLLKEYQHSSLPRSLSIFIGNVEAAAQQQRRLDSQTDYNRIWPGTHYSDSAETDMMQTICNIMRKRKPFASIDIHNNTGYNPHYACVNILNPHCLQLAGMFGNTVVYFTSPKGVQSSAFSDFCPAIVLECGQSGQSDGVAHSLNLLKTVLKLETLPEGHPEHINLHHTVARVTVPDRFTLGTENDADICLDPDLENRNFHQLATGSVFARIGSSSQAQLIANNESNEDVTDEFFELVNNNILLKKDIIIAMYTTNETAIRQDCLCYLMERIHFA